MMRRHAARNTAAEGLLGSPVAPKAVRMPLGCAGGWGVHSGSVRPRPTISGRSRKVGRSGRLANAGPVQPVQPVQPSFEVVYLQAPALAHTRTPTCGETSDKSDRSDGASNRKAFRPSDHASLVGQVRPRVSPGRIGLAPGPFSKHPCACARNPTPEYF